MVPWFPPHRIKSDTWLPLLVTLQLSLFQRQVCTSTLSGNGRPERFCPSDFWV
jgi:hypothetical protein